MHVTAWSVREGDRDHFAGVLFGKDFTIEFLGALLGLVRDGEVAIPVVLRAPEQHACVGPFVFAVDEQFEVHCTVRIDALARHVLGDEDTVGRRVGRRERSSEGAPVPRRQRGDALVARLVARIESSRDLEMAPQDELGLAGEGTERLVGHRDCGSGGGSFGCEGQVCRGWAGILGWGQGVDGYGGEGKGEESRDGQGGECGNGCGAGHGDGLMMGMCGVAALVSEYARYSSEIT